jgi:hypothetical protein
MSRCPVCRSFQVSIVVNAWPDAMHGVSPPLSAQGYCAQCGSRWVQDGSRQQSIKRVRAEPLRPAGRRG